MIYYNIKFSEFTVYFIGSLYIYIYSCREVAGIMGIGFGESQNGPKYPLISDHL